MLNVFRDNLKSLKFVLWFVVIGLVLYLGYYFKTGDATEGPNWAARVDGKALSTDKYRVALENMTEYYRKLMGERFEEIRPQLQLERQVLQQLVDEQIKLQEAGTLGIGTTPEEIARYIQNDPRLRDPATGQFVGKEIYTRSINQRWPGGVVDFEKSIGEMLTTEKWTALATESVAVSDVEVEDTYRARAEKTRLDYVVVPSAKQDVALKLTEPEVEAWYASHTSDYQRGEAKKVRVLVIDRQKQTPKVQVTDADVQANYTQNVAQFERPDKTTQPLTEVSESIRRQLEQQRAQELVQSEATRIQTGLTSAADFDAVAAREGLTVEEHVLARDERAGELGASPQFIAAVWSQTAGAVSPPLGVARGMAFMTVVEDVPAALRPLSEVSDRVRSDVLNHRKNVAARAAAGAALAKHKTLDAAATANSWEIHKDVDAVPKQPLQGTGGSTPELDRALFSPATAKGNVGSAAVPAGAVLYSISQVERFDPATFETKKEGIREELISRKRSDFLQATMEVLREKYKDRVERNDAVVESFTR